VLLLIFLCKLVFDFALSIVLVPMEVSVKSILSMKRFIKIMVPPIHQFNILFKTGFNKNDYSCCSPLCPIEKPQAQPFAGIKTGIHP
jgi:hypothetical protein